MTITKEIFREIRAGVGLKVPRLFHILEILLAATCPFLFIFNNKYNANKTKSRGFSEQRPPERSENGLSSLSERTVPRVA